jgi:hypothetical protein
MRNKMKKKILFLRSAHGKTYNDVDAMREAWVDGLDFRVYPCGPYCSVRDMPMIQAHYDVCVILSTCTTAQYVTFGEL